MTNLAMFNQDQEVTMSTRQIAEITGKLHHHVCRDTRKMLNDLELGETKFGSSYLSSQGKECLEYLLDEELAVCLVSGYNTKFRMAIIQEFKKLKQGKFNLPMTHLDALKQLVASVEENELLKLEAKENEPKIKFHDTVVDSEQNLGLRDAGKQLKKSPYKFIAWLRDNGYLRHNNDPYQKYIDQGLFKMNLCTIPNGKVYKQTRVTTKGLAYFAGKTFNVEI